MATTEYDKLMTSLRALDEMRTSLYDLGVDMTSDRDRIVRAIAMAIELDGISTPDGEDVDIVRFAKSVKGYMAARAMVTK